jgi:AcrR family transcriptional regulator
MTLLNAASDLMIERRTIEVSLSEIAERAQLNAALIRYYFGSKQGMMLALLKSVIGQGVDEMQALVASDRSATEKMRRHIAGIVTLNARYPYVARLIQWLFEDPLLAAELVEAISKPVARGQIALLAQGVAQGEFKPVDPAYFYFIVFGAGEHPFRLPEVLASVYGVEDGGGRLRTDYADTLSDMILGGLRITQPQPITPG